MRVVTVTAPSRLHFGLMIDSAGARYGGVGLMIDQPCTEVRLEPAPELRVTGNQTERARAAIESWHRLAAPRLPSPWHPSAAALPLEVQIRRTPPAHRGLGSGTQLVLSIAAALQRWFFPTQPFTEEIATRLGRARRSAIGTHGFFRGGLIVDGGQATAATLGARLPAPSWPAAWQLVVLIPRDAEGPSGAGEETLFANLPAAPPEVASRLESVLHSQLLPAIEQRDFPRFSEALYAFGYEAGLQFAAVQGGAYNGPIVARMIAAVRAAGVAGTGQSSWGPAVFAVVPSAAAATDLRAAVATSLADLSLEVVIAHASPTGHQVWDRMAG